MKQDQKRELAKTLYLMTDKSQKEICEVVGWTEKTFSANKQKEGWEQLKAARTTSRDNLVGILHIQALKITEAAQKKNRILTNTEVDSISKIASSIEKLEKKNHLESFITVFEQFNKWLVNFKPESAQEINQLQDLFIQNLING